VTTSHDLIRGWTSPLVILYKKIFNFRQGANGENLERTVFAGRRNAVSCRQVFKKTLFLIR